MCAIFMQHLLLLLLWEEMRNLKQQFFARKRIIKDKHFSPETSNSVRSVKSRQSRFASSTLRPSSSSSNFNICFQSFKILFIFVLLKQFRLHWNTLLKLVIHYFIFVLFKQFYRIKNLAFTGIRFQSFKICHRLLCLFLYFSSNFSE